ncbi:hypothetical protein [Streptomyces sporangiiformans]|uniref:Type A2 lantipeptide n=1 Tax=Streptomyces sporangiiformans TaxID=2315329 RepID=A0A505CVQ4_9ACTN|nr:hypothetical protein [Streptomyces sporangiiformans]TPQ15644.1 hypothetical protein FGD71_045955 [Streptomyces sporangiiformans]
MNLTPQVETAEMSDAELDNISGGIGGSASGGLLVDTPLGELTAGLFSAASAEGVTAGGNLTATR